MDKNIIIYGAVAVISYILFRLYLHLNRPNPQFIKYYEEVLNSEKHKVKNRYED